MTQHIPPPIPVPTEYRRHDFLILVALALAPAIGLGVARFAYALILPDMRADLHWSYANAGWMNTTNAAGYLLGAIFAARAIAAFGAFSVMAAGAWSCVLALLLCAFFDQTVPLNAARLLAGLGGGFAFVAGGVLAATVAQRSPTRAAFLLGLFYAGPGLGILLSGISVPFILDTGGQGSWHKAWVALTILALPMAMCLFFARGEHASAPPTGEMTNRRGGMRWLFLGYMTFGAGYIAYMTFMIAWVQGGGGNAQFQALFWAAIGLATMASPWLWGVVHKHFMHGYAFTFLISITAVGASLPLLSDTVPMLLASAVLFGSAFFAVVASTTVFVRRNLPQKQWAASIGGLTVFFGIGQMLGPVAVGIVNDAMQNLSSGLWASVILLCLAAGFGLMQRDHEPS